MWGVSNCSGAQGIEPLQHVQSSPQERLFPLKLSWKPGGGLLGHTEALALHWAMADTELWVIEQIICGKWNVNPSLISYKLQSFRGLERGEGGGEEIDR